MVAITHRVFYKLLPPMIFSSVSSQIACMLIDFILISTFCGADGLTVLALFLPFTYFWDIFDDAFSTGGTTLFAMAKGTRDHRRQQDVISQSLTFLLVLLGTLGILCFVAAPLIVGNLDLPEQVKVSARAYGRWFGLAMGANAFCNVIRNFVNSDSGPRHATVAAVVKIALTIVLEVLFLGKLDLGVEATMYALGLAGVGSALICGLHFYGQRQFFKLQPALLSLGDLRTIFRLAYSKIVENLGLAAVGTVFNYLLLSNFGSMALVIQGALLTIYSVVSSVSVPVINAGNQLVGLYRGEDDAGGILITVRYVLQVNFVIGIILTALMEIFPLETAAVLALDLPGDDGAWIYALRFFALSLVFAFCNLSLLSYYQTLGRARMALILSLLRSVAAPLLCGWLLLFLHSRDLFWLYYLLAELLTMGCMYLVVRRVAREEENPSLLLLDDGAGKDVLSHDFLMNGSEHRARILIEIGRLFFKKYFSRDEYGVYKLKAAMRLLYEYTIRRSTEEKPVTYVRLELLEHKHLIISARWVGEISFLQEIQAEVEIKAMRQLADSVTADRAYGFNYLGLHFYKDREGIPPGLNLKDKI
jgi:Na+-driven multidrug efflux pump